MPRSLWTCLVVAALAGPAAADPPGQDRMSALASSSEARGARCTADGRWCVVLSPPGADGTPRPVVRAAGAPGSRTPPAPAAAPSADEPHSVWPSLVELREGGFLAGVQTETSSAYSGGGGSATELRLFHVSPEGQPGAEPVLTVPLAGSLSIRACFSEEEEERRKGACQDDYLFSGKLSLSDGSAAGRPVLLYRTQASAYPRGVSRSRDSSRMPPLRPEDLVRERDARCSFTRRFRFDAGAGAYRPDSPLPECSDYTVP